VLHRTVGLFDRFLCLWRRSERDREIDSENVAEFELGCSDWAVRSRRDRGAADAGNKTERGG
jgi:hypothetical protein